MITHVTNDEWSQYVSNGEAFAAQNFQGVVAGQFAFTQLFNPIGSGVRVRVFVWEFMTVFAVAVNSNIRRHDVALATLGAFAGPENLLGGGAAPAAEIRSVSQVGALGSTFWLTISAGTMRNDYPTLQLEWGHDLLPGQGMIANSTVGGFSFVGYMWAEVPL